MPLGDMRLASSDLQTRFTGGLLSTNLFHRQFSDKIENVLSEQNNGRWLSRPENAGDGQASGLELEARAPLDVLGLPQLTLWSNATAVHTRLHSLRG